MAKKLMKGNEAIGEAAIQAGCNFFFGYPITPQNEIPEYMSKRLPQVGGTFLQAESEVAAINMVYGAAGSGVRVMTSSSSPGISLKQEGISYIAGAELPCVIVNIVRGGPGLGGIQPAQSDYFQATKGGGHGDYNLIVLAPSTIQEMVDLVQEGFDLADKYRNPVMILGDGMLGQMMEPVDIKTVEPKDYQKEEWAATGMGERKKPNIINSLYLDPEELEEHNLKMQRKYDEITKNEIRVDTYNCEDAELIMVAYGTTARIVQEVIELGKKDGLKLGLIKPITLWPYPYDTFKPYLDSAKAFLSVEMSLGQMVEDVRLAVNGKKPVHFYGRTGGMVPTPEGIYQKVKDILGGTK
ncbi:MAG: 3-methyl-2-oxobutanoate dehydrogenase subunit VorB [Clostridia bacterium]